MREVVSRHRSVSALLVDVPAGHAALLQRTLDDAGWTVRARAGPGRRGALGRAPAPRLAGRPVRRRRPAGGAVAQGARARAPGRPAPAVHRGLAAPPRPATCPRCCAACPTACRPSRTSSKLPGGAHPRARAGADAPARRRRAPAAGRPAGDRRPPRRRPRADRRCATACWPRSASRSASPPARSGARTAPCCAAPRAWHAPGARAAVAALANATREQTLRRRPGPPGPRVGVPAAGLGRRAVRRTRCAPAWSAAPRSRSRSATSASA